MREKKGYLARRRWWRCRCWRCFGGGWWRRLGSRTAAPSSGSGALFFQCFPVTLPVWFSSSFQLFLPLPMFWSSFFFFPRFLSSFGSSSLSPLFFCFLLLLRLLSSVFFSFFLSVRSPPPPLLLCWLLFIEPSEWLFAVEHGEQPAGRPLGATAKARPPLFGFLAGARWVVGHCVRSVGSRRESGRQKFKKKLHFSFLPAA